MAILNSEKSITKEKEACADFILGTLYFEGWGVEKNQAKGLNYYKKALYYAEKMKDSTDIINTKINKIVR